MQYDYDLELIRKTINDFIFLNGYMMFKISLVLFYFFEHLIVYEFTIRKKINVDIPGVFNYT